MMEYLNSINQLKTGFFDFIPIEVLLFIPTVNLIQGFYFFNSKFFYIKLLFNQIFNLLTSIYFKFLIYLFFTSH